MGRFPGQSWLLSIVHKFSIVLRSGLWEDHSSSFMLSCFINSKTSFAVFLGLLTCWNTHWCPGSPPMTMTLMSMMSECKKIFLTCDLPEFCISLNGC